MQAINSKKTSCLPTTRVNGDFRVAKAIGLLLGWVVSVTAVAQITPAQERDIGTRNQQELQRQQQQEQQQR